MRLSALFLFCLSCVSAQLPDFYQSLPRIIWSVDDLRRVESAWEKIGVPYSMPVSRFANVDVYWMESKARKPGVFALAYPAPSMSAMQQERKRLESLGVRLLERGEVTGGVYYLVFDTAKEGKFHLGLIYDPGKSGARSDLKITQFALTARNLDAVSAYWQKLGFPPFTFTRGGLSDKEYRGKPADFDMRLGWQRHLSVPFEWIEPLKGPNVYEDHIAAYGEGFHHIAFNVDDMEQANAFWDRLGYSKVMSGSWGTEGKPGSGRFAYHDTHSIGGVDIELLWNYR